jgi:TRAP-type C4-dicarboxylate transport system substrate-binding protein
MQFDDWRKLAGGLVLAAAIGYAGATPAQEAASYNWQFATFITEDSALTVPAARWISSWGERSGADINVDFFYLESLLKATAVLPGVSDGRVALGQTTTLYHPAETPLSQIAGMPFLTDDIEASARAFNKLYDTNEDFRAVWDKLNIHVLSFVPISGNVIGSSFPVETVEDLAGKKIRAAGLVAIAIGKVGANAIALPAPEIYQAMERGLLDGWTTNPFEVTVSLGWPEVSKYYTDPGTGLFNMNVLMMNKAVWESLPESLQAAIENSRDEYITDAVRYTIEQEALACDRFLEMGGVPHMLAASEAEKIKTLVGTAALEKWTADVAGRGVDPAAAQAFYDDYVAALDEFSASSTYKTPPLAACETRAP